MAKGPNSSCILHSYPSNGKITESRNNIPNDIQSPNQSYFSSPIKHSEVPFNILWTSAVVFFFFNDLLLAANETTSPMDCVTGLKTCLSTNE